jgi:hypothetical protein
MKEEVAPPVTVFAFFGDTLTANVFGSAVWNVLLAESTGVELPVGVDSAKKFYEVSGLRPVKVKE